MTLGTRRKSMNKIRKVSSSTTLSTALSSSDSLCSMKNETKRPSVTRIHIPAEHAEDAFPLGSMPKFEIEKKKMKVKTANLKAALQTYELQENTDLEIDLEKTQCYKAIRQAQFVLKLCFCYLRPACTVESLWDYVKQIVRYLIMLIMTFIMLVLIAQFINSSVLCDDGASVKMTNVEMAMLLGILAFNMQSVVGAWFAAYWAASGRLRHIYFTIERINSSRGHHKYWWYILIEQWFCKLLLFSVIAASAVNLFNTESQYSIRSNYYNTEEYVTRFIRRLHVLYNVWSLPTWFATQFAYIMVLNSIHVELMYFNESMRHANDKLANADVLEKFHHKLFEYVDMVAVANIMFNWSVIVLEKFTLIFRYIFAMIAFNVPTLLILCYVLLSPTNALTVTTNSIVGSLVGLLLVQLVALCILPAMIYDDLESSRDIVLVNGAVWKSSTSTLDRLQTFLNHMQAVKDSSTMLSAGGFAVITRNFLLTVLSAVFTYLLIVLQFENSNNNMVGMNSTNITN